MKGKSNKSSKEVQNLKEEKLIDVQKRWPTKGIENSSKAPNSGLQNALDIRFTSPIYLFEEKKKTISFAEELERRWEAWFPMVSWKNSILLKLFWHQNNLLGGQNEFQKNEHRDESMKVFRGFHNHRDTREMGILEDKEDLSTKVIGTLSFGIVDRFPWFWMIMNS